MRSYVKVAMLACGILFLLSARQASATTLYGWTWMQSAYGTLAGYNGMTVRLCTNNNGTGLCYATTTYYNCYAGLCGSNWYQLTVPDGYWWYIFLYDYRAGTDWGSSSSPSVGGFGGSLDTYWYFNGPVYSVFNIVTAPAPHPASAVYPSNGQDVPRSFTLKWTNGSDAYRSNYSIVYDIYGRGEGAQYVLEASNIACNPDGSGNCQMAINNIKTNTKYYWYVVSKINPGYYSPNPYFTRDSSEFNFTTQVDSNALNSFAAYSPYYYLSASGCGGGALNAQATSQGSCESFKIIDANGGSIESGDTVNVQLGNYWYVVAEGGGGGDVNVNRTAAGVWETFTIEKLSGSSGSRILHGDRFALRTYNGNYIQAYYGGGNSVNATPTVASWWETFILVVHD